MKRNLSQKGQTLLIVVFAMSLGLLVMISVASRVVNSVARTTQTNYYQKAVATAEAGAEVYSAKSLSDLAGYAVACPATALNAAEPTSPCVETFAESRAFIGVEAYPVDTESLEVKSDPGETIHVNLQNLPADVNALNVCWYGVDGGDYSTSYYFLYSGAIGSYSVTKDLKKCNSANSWCNTSLASLSSSIKEAEPDGDSSCYSVTVPSPPIAALRIFTSPGGGMYKISAFNVGGSLVARSLGVQGYRIISVGEVTSGVGGSLDKKKATRKKVIVEKTKPYPAGPWEDFAVTSLNGKVSNTP